MSITLLTYNIHKGFTQTKQFSLPDMQLAIAEKNPDIVCLQELQGQHIDHQKNIMNWPEQSQLDFLAGTQWPYCVYGKNVQRKKRDHGNGILTKLPINHSDNIDISAGPLSSRGLLHAILEYQGKPLHIMCTHLGLLKKERVVQYEDLTQRIKKHVPLDEPMIIAGDFNDWLSQAEQHLREDLQLKEVFSELQGKHAKSFPAIKPTFRVDRIYYRGVELIDGEVLTAEPWNKLSDHVPLWAEFNL